MEVTPASRPLEEGLARFFLFGFLLVLIDPRETVLVGAGDGLYAIDGRTTVLEPGEGNAPDYPAYGVLSGPSTPGSRNGAAGSIHLHEHLPTADLTSMLIATDGALPLVDGSGAGSLFACSGRLALPARPRALQKRLNVLGARPGLLHDDTTLVHVERRVA